MNNENSIEKTISFGELENDLNSDFRTLENERRELEDACKLILQRVFKTQVSNLSSITIKTITAPLNQVKNDLNHINQSSIDQDQNKLENNQQVKTIKILPLL